MIYGYLAISVAVCGIITACWIKYSIARAKARRLEQEAAKAEAMQEGIYVFNENIKKEEAARKLQTVKQQQDLKHVVETLKQKPKVRNHFE